MRSESSETCEKGKTTVKEIHPGLSHTNVTIDEVNIDNSAVVSLLEKQRELLVDIASKQIVVNVPAQSQPIVNVLPAELNLNMFGKSLLHIADSIKELKATVTVEPVINIPEIKIPKIEFTPTIDLGKAEAPKIEVNIKPLTYAVILVFLAIVTDIILRIFI